MTVKFVRDPETGLTPHEEKFCRAFVAGKNQSGAYRVAFPRSRRWQRRSVYVRASRLAARPEIRARIEALLYGLRKPAKSRSEPMPRPEYRAIAADLRRRVEPLWEELVAVREAMFHELLRGGWPAIPRSVCAQIESRIRQAEAAAEYEIIRYRFEREAPKLRVGPQRQELGAWLYRAAQATRNQTAINTAAELLGRHRIALDQVRRLARDKA